MHSVMLLRALSYDEAMRFGLFLLLIAMINAWRRVHCLHSDRALSKHVQLTTARYFSFSKRDASGNSYSASRSSSIPVIPRNASNFASKWQMKGEKYVSYDKLIELNNILTRYSKDRSVTDRRILLDELSITYFARLHNIIRVEYQFERELVEERLKSWSMKRLQKEGFTLSPLKPTFKGNLYSDRVYRFQASAQDQKLPFHRFGVGDSIRISNSQGGSPLDETNSVDGTVLERRQKYLDVCIASSDAVKIAPGGLYRLDTYVNRISYDRMIEALQIFVSPEVSCSRIVRDLVLYSYPNCMIRLANSPGGLKLALPIVDELGDVTTTLSDSRRIVDRSQKASVTAANDVSENDDEVLRKISSALGTEDLSTEAEGRNVMHSEADEELSVAAAVARIAAQRIRALRGDEMEDPSISSKDKEEQTSAAQQLQQTFKSQYMRPLEFIKTDRVQISAPLQQVLPEKIDAKTFIKNSSSFAKEVFNGTESGPLYASPPVLTVKEALTQLTKPVAKQMTGRAQFYDASVKFREGPSGGRGRELLDMPVEADLKVDAIFKSNERMMAMAQKFQGTGDSPVIPYTPQEISQALASLDEVKLNPSQVAALSGAVTRPLSLIQGPPGTGKTRTACAILASLVGLKATRLAAGGERARGQQQMKVLACAHSNTATDNLLEGLIKLGVKVVRIGRPVNVRTVLWDHTLDARLLRHPSVVAARERLDEAVAYYSELRAQGLGGEDFGSAQRMLASCKKRLDEVEAQCITQILKDADVVVSTCIGSGGETIRNFVRNENIKFSTVLIDEAAQCMEAASMPALVHGCERLVLIGDQNQLPPVVASPVALEYGLGVSLFSRLAAGGLVPMLLDQQYRMHPMIADFPSKMFYGGRVKSQVLPEERPLPAGFAWPRSAVPIIFIDVSPKEANRRFNDALQYDYSEEESEGSSVPIGGGFEKVSNSSQASYYNSAEVEVVLSVLQNFIESGDLQLDDIGVISPYNAQVRLLADRFREKGWLESSSSSSVDPGRFSALLESDGGAVPLSAENKMKFSRKGEKGRNSYSIYSNDRERNDDRRDDAQRQQQRESPASAAAAQEAIEVPKSRSSVAKLRDDLAQRFAGGSPYGYKSLSYISETRKQGVHENNDSIEKGERTGKAEKQDEVRDASNPPEWVDQSLGGALAAAGPTYIAEADDAAATTLSVKGPLNGRPTSDRPLGGSNAENKSEGVTNTQQLEVRSVDGFQGREKNLIIISSVRSNRQGRVGFLKDWRRLNVALTRARSGLIVVGDSKTLANERHWRAFVDWCKEEGCFVSANIDGDVLAEHYADGTMAYKEKFSSVMKSSNLAGYDASTS